VTSPMVRNWIGGLSNPILPAKERSLNRPLTCGLVTPLNNGVIPVTNPELMVALTALPRELTALTGKQAPSYRKLWSLIVDGHVSAKQVNGRYQVPRNDLPAIAALLGLTAPEDNAVSKIRKA